MIVGARRFVDRQSACYIHTEPYALFSYMYIYVVVVVACYRAIVLIVASRAIPTAALLPPKNSPRVTWPIPTLRWRSPACSRIARFALTSQPLWRR